SSMGSGLKSLLTPQGQAPWAGVGLEQKQAAAQQSADEMKQRQAAGYSPAYQALAPIAESIGVPAGGMEEAARQGNSAGGVGQSATPLVALGAGEALGHGVPAIKEALPSTERAGAALKQVKAMAGDVPIDMAKPGDTALQLLEQSQRGATLPKVV